MPTLQQLVESAYAKAISSPYDDLAAGPLHQCRSRNWVESLAEQFRSAYAGDTSVRVFSKKYDGNRCDFGINEAL